ncbi:putative cytochrome b561/ferric reductase transmembrane [Dioscorea sansibarensis]
MILENGVGNGFGVVRRHGLMVMIGWGVLVPIGVMVARYFKKKNELGHHPTNWFNTHMCIQALGFGLGLGGIIAGFGLTKANDESVTSHKSLAISILAFGSLQVIYSNLFIYICIKILFSKEISCCFQTWFQFCELGI